MKFCLLIGVWLCFQIAALAQPVQTQTLHDHVPAAVTGLRPTGRLPATNILHLTIGLPLRNREALTNLLQRLYDPANPDYHHYLTPGQFTERFGPTAEDYQAVSNFASANGLTVTGTHPNRTLLDVSGPVAEVERTFHMLMHTYRHPKEARTFFAPDAEPSLNLAVPVLHIGGLDTYALPHPAGLRLKPAGRDHASINGTSPNHLSGSGPGGNYMGYDFRSAYVPGVSLTGAGQIVGLLECDGYNMSDITNYESRAGLPNVPLQNVLVDGFNGIPQDPNAVVEVSLDIEMAISMAPGLASVMVYEVVTDPVVDGTPAYIYDMLNRMATDNQAKQISSSWVFRNDALINQVFQEFAVQGQSFFEASGDEDAYTASTFQWDDDPYITLVGGTTLTTSGPGGAWASETVWNWGVEFGAADDGVGTGGGISTSIPIPSWQQGINMTASGGSTNWRNIPDVALTADNIFVQANGIGNDGVGGTSCAAPLWAGFIALVNQQATSTGQPTAGFINPAVYALGKGPGYTSVFHDITTGNNTWSGSPGAFYAVSGYDLCTGWGTPAGASLIDALAPPDALSISPASGFSSSGGVGGPFTVTSQNYILTNVGASALDWTLASPAPWLTVSPGSGTLTPGGPAAVVTVSLNAAASNLMLGSYNASVSFTNLGDGVAQSRPFALSVISPPTVTLQPGNLAVPDGTTATFNVGINGGQPLSYHWQANSNNLIDGGRISGSSTGTLVISNISPADVAYYRVIVTNAAGATASSNALLTALPGNVDHFSWNTIPSPQVFNAPFTTGLTALDRAGVIATNFGGAANLAGFFGGSSVSAVEDFESGIWPHAPWIFVPGGAGAGTISPANAHDGGYGLRDPDWTYRTDVVVGNAGDVLSWWIRPGSSSGGRAYLGFGVSSGGGWAIVAAPNTSQFIIQHDVNFTTYNEIVSATQAWQAATWYKVAVKFTSASAMVCSLYGPDGQTLLNTLSYGSVTGLPGGVAMRSFGGFSLDTLQSGGGGTPMAIFPTNTGPFVNGIWSGNIAVLQAATNAILTANDGAGHAGSSLAFNVIYTNQPPLITLQPGNQTAVIGSNATFTVAASGTPTLNYYWSRNNVPIAGANASSYTTNNVQFSDYGSQFSCLVSNAYGSTNSSSALLTVVPNTPVVTAAFVRSSAGDPWSRNDDETILTRVFGTNWQASFYESVDATSLFSPSTGFIFMEGGDIDASGMAAFLNTHQALMQNWVSNGGSLFLNAAPNEGGNLNFGFGVTLVYDGATFTSTAAAINPAAAIFNGPLGPAGTNWTGNWFAHGTVTGPGLTPLIKDTSNNRIVLAEATAGSGHVLFGGMTLPAFHLPQPQATNLLANILSYGAAGAGVVVAISPPGNANEFNALAGTLTNFGFRVRVMSNGPWTGVNVVLSYPGCLSSYGPSLTDISNGVNFIKISDWGANWTPVTYQAIAQGAPITIGLGAAHPITAGLPACWVGGGFWSYGGVGNNFIAWSTDTTLPSLAGQVSPYSVSRLLAANTIGTGRAAFIGWNIYGSNAGPNDLAVLRNAILWAAGLSSNTNNSPVITMQPAGQSITVGNSVTFNVAASGAPTLIYNWSRNNVPIPGANASSYTTNSVRLSDYGSQFSCLVSNAYGSTNSSNALLTTLTRNQVLITFDDLPAAGQVVPAGYNNLTWSNFDYLNGLASGQPSGYGAGLISGSNVAFNAFGTAAAISSPMPFNLVSAYLTAAWDDNLQVEAQGYSGATLVHDNTYTLSATAPTLITFNYTNITEAQFISSGGTPHPGYADSGMQFAMDNVTIGQPQLTVIPIGGTLILTWPAGLTGFNLFSTTNLAPPVVWTPVSPGPVVINQQNVVSNPSSGTQQYFRLSQ